MKKICAVCVGPTACLPPCFQSCARTADGPNAALCGKSQQPTEILGCLKNGNFLGCQRNGGKVETVVFASADEGCSLGFLYPVLATTASCHSIILNHNVAGITFHVPTDNDARDMILMMSRVPGLTVCKADFAENSFAYFCEINGS